jgi:Zinc knuckle
VAAAAWVDTLVAEGKNATSVVKLGTLLATALKVAAEATAVVAMAVDTVAAPAVVVVAAEEGKHATPVADSDICLVTAPKAKSATTVSGKSPDQASDADKRHTGGEVGHLSRDCPSEASSERVCYKCKQPGHVQASCPN